MNEPPKRSLSYRAQAELEARAAEQSPLAQQRETHARASAAWSELAAQEEAREAERERRAGLAQARAASADADSPP